jgi:hypothetical protein
MVEIHPAASDHLPAFITAPGQTDVLMVVMAIILALAILGFGLVFLRLHTLPERMAHKSQKIQFEVVAVLGLIALFTHMHIFWIAGMLLALIDFPDFGTSLKRIAGSAEKVAGLKPGEGLTDLPGEAVDVTHGHQPDAPPEADHAAGLGDGAKRRQDLPRQSGRRWVCVPKTQTQTYSRCRPPRSACEVMFPIR